MIFKIATSSLLDIVNNNTVNANNNDKSDWNFEKRDGMLYAVVRAVSVGTNGNGDHFTYPELKKSYKTFIGKGVFVNHQSSDIEKKRGMIVDAKFIEDRGPENAYVIAMLEINAEAFPELARMIRAGHANSVSMGCSVAYSNCSICGHAAKTTKDYCFPDNTKITMFDGSIKNIQEIAVGDIVLSSYGTPDEVTEIMSRHIEEDIIEFVFAGSNENLKATVEHPILAYKNDWAKCSQCRTIKSCTHVSKNKNPQFIHADYLSVGDYFLTPSNYLNTKFVSKDLAEFIGYYAAEGCLSKVKGKLASVQFSLAAKESETIGLRIKEISEKLFNITPRIYFNNSNGCSIRIHNANVAELVDKLCPGKARTKQINSAVMLSDTNSQISLLSAMIEGDGYYDSVHEAIVYRTASDQLANQINQLAKNLGYFTKIHKTNQNSGPNNREKLCKTTAVTITKTDSNNEIHKLSFGKLSNINSCSESAISLFKINNHIALKIKEKRYIPFTGMVYNFETKDTHSYVANGVGVHNCVHVRMHKGGAYNGRPVYEINNGVEFIEISMVTVGADANAKVLEVIARKNGLDLNNLIQNAGSTDNPLFMEKLQSEYPDEGMMKTDEGDVSDIQTPPEKIHKNNETPESFILIKIQNLVEEAAILKKANLDNSVILSELDRWNGYYKKYKISILENQFDALMNQAKLQIESNMDCSTILNKAEKLKSIINLAKKS